VSIDLDKAFKIKLKKVPKKELYWAECSCNGYRSPRPTSETMAEALGRRHVQNHIDRLRRPWTAILVGVGTRYLGEGRRAVQLLATTVENNASSDKTKPAFKIDMTPAGARSLAAELNRYADEAEDL